MRKIILLSVVGLVLFDCLLFSNNKKIFQANAEKFDYLELFNSHIEDFNKQNVYYDKEETFFSEVTNSFIVKNEDKEIGYLLVFDNNKGYIAFSEDRVVFDHNYLKGLDNIHLCRDGILNYNGVNYYSNSGELIHQKDTGRYYGVDIGDDFYWHADSNFVNAKVRYLQHDLDPSYSTLTNTSTTTFYNKTTWSTVQGDDPDCGPLALANLLWTYKINGVVDLTMGAASSYDLAYNLRPYLHYSSTNGVVFTDMLYGDDYFSSTGYTLDYTNVVNGIGDTLVTTPLIGAYYHNGGHFALVTGKGKSVYQVIFGIKFYTYWDITNTWHNRYSTSGGYYKCKYWVDNQYINYGFVLKDPNGNVVHLTD